MTKHGKERLRISRRAALTTGTMFALSGTTAATLVRQAAAQQKISQAIAKYQDTPSGNAHCAVCGNFQSPNACKFVQGDISPKGWCQLFSPATP
jgi:hypothetical protein